MSVVGDPSSRDTIPVIVGPTAAGKTALVLALAERAPLTILSADSRQVYRGFDIGTAKPSREEQRLVPHRGLDVADPGERYSASRWAAAAEGWLDEARAAGRVPVIVGGTGFYVRALFAPLFEEPPLDAARRRRLEAVLAQLSFEELRRWCEALDPARAHLGRTQLLRAIEVALLTGERVSRLHAERARAPRFRARYLVVDPGPVLAERIERRALGMVRGGWVDEVRRLDRAVPDDAPAWNSTGYLAVRRHARGEIDEAAMLNEVIVGTRQYAKRQRTWFRHQLVAEDVTRVNPLAADARDVVAAWWRGARAA